MYKYINILNPSQVTPPLSPNPILNQNIYISFSDTPLPTLNPILNQNIYIFSDTPAPPNIQPNPK